MFQICKAHNSLVTSLTLNAPLKKRDSRLKRPHNSFKYHNYVLAQRADDEWRKKGFTSTCSLQSRHVFHLGEKESDFEGCEAMKNVLLFNIFALSGCSMCRSCNFPISLASKLVRWGNGVRSVLLAEWRQEKLSAFNCEGFAKEKAEIFTKTFCSSQYNLIHFSHFLNENNPIFSSCDCQAREMLLSCRKFDTNK